MTEQSPLQLPGPVRLEDPVQPGPRAPDHAAVRLRLPLPLGGHQPQAQQRADLHAPRG